MVHYPTSHFVAILLFLGITVTHATNDWSKPCFGGECNWDIMTDTASATMGSGTIRVVGSQTGISDITPAGGWTILDCDQTAADQDIRLVCHDPDMGCAHLSENGAEGTLLRLPQDCASVPFAMVTRQWVHHDQTIPPSKRSLIVHRDGWHPTVKGITLSTDFGGAHTQTHGNVEFYLQASSMSGVATNFTRVPPARMGSTEHGLDSWVKETVLDLNGFNKDFMGSSPINFEKNALLFNQSIGCPQNGTIPAFGGEVRIGLDCKVNGTVNYGVAVAGTIIPPAVTHVGIFVGLPQMNVSGTLHLNTTLVGSISTGAIPLFTAGLPGLDFPKVFSLGPTFSISAEATASMDVNMNVGVGTDYTISDAELFFPPSIAPSNGAYVPGNSSVQRLAVSPNVVSHGQIAAHLIPTLAFGIDLFDGRARSTVDLSVNADAAVDLTLAKAAGQEFDGCVDVSTGLSVDAGEDTHLLRFFDDNRRVTLFRKTFDMFKKCFGSTPPRRVFTGRAARAAIMAKRFGITCPSSPLGAPESVVSEDVPA